MYFIKSFRKRFFIFLAVCFTVMAISYIQTIAAVPGKLTLLEGEEYIYNFKSPFFVNIKADRDDIIKLNGGEIKTSGSYLKLSDPICLRTQKKGSVNLNIRVFGLIPLKTMKVDIVPNKKIIACGNTIGVRLKIDGVLVIGVTDVEGENGKKYLPARESGIKTGDVLVEVNGTKLNSIDDLTKAIEKSQGGNIGIKYKRGDNYRKTEVTPIKDSGDKKYHIGLWVRDGTAGIGTLTFYDPVTKSFGALGHGITDIDTGMLMPIESGELLESNILAVKKGQQGNPGELRGVFVEENKLGLIDKNTEHGIYGTLDAEEAEKISNKEYPIGLRSQIKEGPATILANIDGKNVNEYTIEIERVSRQNFMGSKGMVIRITDKRLLDSTGGIVQGMSGSPILQDGRIIGAVTHVLVNDPSRGYGIFIENMLRNVVSGNQQALGKAA
ncbi:MAG: SpoIVB peptidase [Clostridia bacterium]|nr:SpoIVB peptidase [Clostridia bacterium]